jgi:hypothetical protein
MASAKNPARLTAPACVSPLAVAMAASADVANEDVVVRELVALLRNNGDTAAQARGISLLAGWVAARPGNALAAGDAGALDAVVALLRARPGEDDIFVLSCGLLTVLLDAGVARAWDAATVEAASHAVQCCMAAQLPDPDAQGTGCAGLYALFCGCVDASRDAEAGGAIDALLSALRVHTHHDNLHALTWRVLRELYERQTHSARRVVDGGVFAVAVASLRAHVSLPSVHCDACALLRALLTSPEEDVQTLAHAAAAAAGAVGAALAAVRVLSACDKDAELFGHAIALLLTLLAVPAFAEAEAQAVRDGALEAVLPLLPRASTEEHATLVCATLACLTRKDVHVAGAAACGAVEACVHVLRVRASLPGALMVARSVLVVLARLVQVGAAAAAAHRAGAAPLVRAAMDAHGDDVPVAQAAARLMEALQREAAMALQAEEVRMCSTTAPPPAGERQSKSSGDTGADALGGASGSAVDSSVTAQPSAAARGAVDGDDAHDTASVLLDVLARRRAVLTSLLTSASDALALRRLLTSPHAAALLRQSVELRASAVSSLVALMPPTPNANVAPWDADAVEAAHAMLHDMLRTELDDDVSMALFGLRELAHRMPWQPMPLPPSGAALMLTLLRLPQLPHLRPGRVMYRSMLAWLSWAFRAEEASPCGSRDTVAAFSRAGGASFLAAVAKEELAACERGAEVPAWSELVESPLRLLRMCAEEDMARAVPQQPSDDAAFLTLPLLLLRSRIAPYDTRNAAAALLLAQMRWAEVVSGGSVSSDSERFRSALNACAAASTPEDVTRLLRDTADGCAASCAGATVWTVFASTSELWDGGKAALAARAEACDARGALAAARVACMRGRAARTLRAAVQTPRPVAEIVMAEMLVGELMDKARKAAADAAAAASRVLDATALRAAAAAMATAEAAADAAMAALLAEEEAERGAKAAPPAGKRKNKGKCKKNVTDDTSRGASGSGSTADVNSATAQCTVATQDAAGSNDAHNDGTVPAGSGVLPDELTRRRAVLTSMLTLAPDALTLRRLMTSPDAAALLRESGELRASALSRVLALLPSTADPSAVTWNADAVEAAHAVLHDMLRANETGDGGIKLCCLRCVRWRAACRGSRCRCRPAARRSCSRCCACRTHRRMCWLGACSAVW